MEKRRVDPRDLRFFAAMPRAGPRTAAAKTLHVSQPTLAVAMQNLEEELKSQLPRSRAERRAAHRHGRGAAEVRKRRLSPARSRRPAPSAIKGLQSDDEGASVIGRHESLGAYFLPDFVAQLLRDHPQSELLISNESSAMVRGQRHRANEFSSGSS